MTKIVSVGYRGEFPQQAVGYRVVAKEINGIYLNVPGQVYRQMLGEGTWFSYNINWMREGMAAGHPFVLASEATFPGLGKSWFYQEFNYLKLRKYPYTVFGRSDSKDMLQTKLERLVQDTIEATLLSLGFQKDSHKQNQGMVSAEIIIFASEQLELQVIRTLQHIDCYEIDVAIKNRHEGPLFGLLGILEVVEQAENVSHSYSLDDSKGLSRIAHALQRLFGEVQRALSRENLNDTTEKYWRNTRQSR